MYSFPIGQGWCPALLVYSRVKHCIPSLHIWIWLKIMVPVWNCKLEPCLLLVWLFGEQTKIDLWPFTNCELNSNPQQCPHVCCGSTSLTLNPPNKKRMIRRNAVRCLVHNKRLHQLIWRISHFCNWVSYISTGATSWICSIKIHNSSMTSQPTNHGYASFCSNGISAEVSRPPTSWTMFFVWFTSEKLPKWSPAVR